MKSIICLGRFGARTAAAAAFFALVLLAPLIGCKQTQQLTQKATQPKPVDLGLLGAPSAQPNATQSTAQSGKPVAAAKAPARGFIWLDDKGNMKVGKAAGKSSQVFLLQVFGFDEKTKEAGDVGGIVMTLADSPVPIVIYAMGYGLTGSMCGKYSNLILDFSAAKGQIPALHLGEVDAADGGKTLSDVYLNVGSLNELFISPDYVVFPGQQRDVQQDGPFALVDLAPGKAGQGAAGSTLVLTRNGTEVTRKKLGDGADYAITLKRVRSSNDVLAWRIEDATGKITYQGALGFPVSGATPDMVRYTADLERFPVKPGK